jgi:hypothetical protein
MVVRTNANFIDNAMPGIESELDALYFMLNTYDHFSGFFGCLVMPCCFCRDVELW